MHIDNKELERFQNNSMGTEDMIAFLEHLDTCNFCLDQMIHQEEQQSVTNTPAYLKEQILARAVSPDVKAAHAVSATSRKMQLFYYSLRTAAGVLAALFLLFTIGQVDFSSLRPSRSPVRTEASAPEPHDKSDRGHLYDFTQGLSRGLSESANKMTGYLNDFSNKLINGGK